MSTYSSDPQATGTLQELSLFGVAPDKIAALTDDDDNTGVNKPSGGPGTFTDTYTFSLDAIPASDEISEVRLLMRGGVVGVSLATTQAVAYIGGTPYLGDVQSAVEGGTYDWVQTWLLNPSTGLPWTRADVLAAEFGVALYKPHFLVPSHITLELSVEVDAVASYVAIPNDDETLSGVYQLLAADATLQGATYLNGTGKIGGGNVVPPGEALPVLLVYWGHTAPDAERRSATEMELVLRAVARDIGPGREDRARLGRILQRAMQVLTGHGTLSRSTYRYEAAWPVSVLGGERFPEQGFSTRDATLAVRLKRV